eukprot:8494269-Lingulodinium_polyedra.AAC.1
MTPRSAKPEPAGRPDLACSRRGSSLWPMRTALGPLHKLMRTLAMVCGNPVWRNRCLRRSRSTLSKNFLMSLRPAPMTSS